MPRLVTQSKQKCPRGNLLTHSACSKTFCVSTFPNLGTEICRIEFAEWELLVVPFLYRSSTYSLCIDWSTCLRRLPRFVLTPQLWQRQNISLPLLKAYPRALSKFFLESPQIGQEKLNNPSFFCLKLRKREEIRRRYLIFVEIDIDTYYNTPSTRCQVLIKKFAETAKIYVRYQPN